MKKQLILFLFIFLLATIANRNLRGQIEMIFPRAEETFSYSAQEPLFFIWSDTLLAHTPYTLEIYSVNQGQLLSDALNHNLPIYSQSDIYSFSLLTD